MIMLFHSIGFLFYVSWYIGEALRELRRRGRNFVYGVSGWFNSFQGCEEAYRLSKLISTLVTPSFREPWLNRGEGARGDRDEPEGGYLKQS